MVLGLVEALVQQHLLPLLLDESPASQAAAWALASRGGAAVAVVLSRAELLGKACGPLLMAGALDEGLQAVSKGSRGHMAQLVRQTQLGGSEEFKELLAQSLQRGQGVARTPLVAVGPEAVARRS